MKKGWVLIKKGHQESVVPFQAFKDVFEKDGFTLKEDVCSSVNPTFSNSNDEPKQEKKEEIAEVQSESTIGKRKNSKRPSKQ